MNYTNIYNQLIQKGKARTTKLEFPEVHHIIPRCLNGTDDEDNLVTLTPEEHLLAHLLLTRIQPDNGSVMLALLMMLQSSFATPGRASFNKKYARWRREVVNDLRELHWWTNGVDHKRSKDCPGDGYELGMLNEAWNKGIPMTEERKLYHSQVLKGRPQPQKSEDARARSGHKGTIWWTNGIKNKRSISQPAPDWTNGFSVKTKGSKGMSWWNNGAVTKLFLVPPSPEWVKGRLLS